MSCSRSIERRIILSLAVLILLPRYSQASAAFAADQVSDPAAQTSSQKANPAIVVAPAAPTAPSGRSAPELIEQAPRGTATAPELRPDGIAASSAAGAAIAPIKQKRIRRLALTTAILVGAAVAIGVVVGASAATPARK